MTDTIYGHKIKPEHLSRKAIVYFRQSSDRQVTYNKESQILQYAMTERVRALGWKQVEVINSDLGSSAGIASAQREGFERVISQVALGEVGIVGSREVSRLSRTDKDWCRLLEVCQIFGTLIADEQQVYDLSYLDDQLVLGIKGTLSVVDSKSCVNDCSRVKSPKPDAGKCSRDYRLGMQKTPSARSHCIPINESAKQSGLYSRNSGSFGACVRHSTGSVITTWSCRPTRSKERSWSGNSIAEPDPRHFTQPFLCWRLCVGAASGNNIAGRRSAREAPGRDAPGRRMPRLHP